MSRTVDPKRRSELLERIVAYVAANGLSDLQLRPLASVVGSSPRGLLYYFRSKEKLIAEVLARAGTRQRAIFATLPREPRSYAQTIRAAWALVSAPEHEPVFRLFFEVYGLALQDRERFPGFFERAIDGWLGYLEAPAIQAGYGPDDARALATVMLAGCRGFLLDLCATSDRGRLARAVELWIIALEGCPGPAKPAPAWNKSASAGA